MGRLDHGGRGSIVLLLAFRRAVQALAGLLADEAALKVFLKHVFLLSLDCRRRSAENSTAAVVVDVPTWKQTSKDRRGELRWRLRVPTKCVGCVRWNGWGRGYREAGMVKMTAASRWWEMKRMGDQKQAKLSGKEDGWLGCKRLSQRRARDQVGRTGVVLIRFEATRRHGGCVGVLGVLAVLGPGGGRCAMLVECVWWRCRRTTGRRSLVEEDVRSRREKEGGGAG